MKVRVAINGFGRIGRLSLRAIEEAQTKDVEIVAINCLSDFKTDAHLLKYDSIQGHFAGSVELQDNELVVNGKKIKLFSERDPSVLPWKELDIDVVYECTGIFVAKEKAMSHIKAGAKKVLISAPGKNSDITVVYGINHDQITKDHQIISNASCTTNCLAPLAYILHKEFGIEKGYMTTIHSYTGDQRLLDALHPSDLRRARAANLSMIPTTTGAAKAVGLVLPELNGKLDGTSIRVPTPTVSIVDFKLITKKNVTVENVNQVINQYANSSLKGILDINKAPLVSIDFVHNPHSSIFDETETQVVDGNLVRVMSWYDNEWGFSNRMSDTAKAIMKASK